MSNSRREKMNRSASRRTICLGLLLGTGLAVHLATPVTAHVLELEPGFLTILSLLAPALLIGSLAHNRNNAPGLKAVPQPLVRKLATRADDMHESEGAGRTANSLDRITRILEEEAIDTVFQPLVDLASAEVVGAEALARFRTESHRAPDSVFREAKAAGLGAELEILAIRLAMQSIDKLPENVHVSLNASPDTLQHPDLYKLLAEREYSNRLVIELTEHAQVTDYETLLETIRRLRAIGVRFAVDDMGAGFANLRHVIRLDPDIIKLDIGLTRDIDRDMVSQAMALALVSFGRETRTTIVAEGIETEAELATLRQLGVDWGQGYFLARPGALPLATIDLAPATKYTEGKNQTAASASRQPDRVWSVDQYEQLTKEAERAAPRRASGVHILGGAALVGIAFLYATLPGQIPAWVSSAMLATCALLAGIVCLRAAWSNGVRNNSPWHWFALASFSWVAASTYWMIRQPDISAPLSYPSFADFGMLAFFPMFAIGLMLIVRKGLEQTPLPQVLADGMILLTFVVIMIVEVLALPAETTATASPGPLLVTTALIALAVPVIFLAPLALVWQRRLLGSGPVALMLAGALAVSAGTIVYSRMALEGTFILNHPIELAWIVGFAMIAGGAHAVHRLNWWQGQRAPHKSERVAPALQIVVPGFAVIAFAILAVYGALSSEPNWLIAFGVLFTSIILAMRLASTSLNIERLTWRLNERDRMESVLEASVTIANTNDIDALLQRVAEVSANATRSARAQIRIYGDDRSQIQAMGEFGLTSTERAIASRLTSVPLGIIPGERQALDTLLPKVQRSDDSQLLPEVQGLLQACGKDVTLIAPLIADRQVIGVIETWSPASQKPFEPVDLAALAVIGQEAGIAIQNTQLLKELHWQANHDGLTGLLNHRSAFEALEKALDSAIENDEPLSILISDINNFKQINDSYGHLLGDRVLVVLSQALRGSLRATETAGRYGGDEFLAILPKRDAAQAESLARHVITLANVQIKESSSVDIEVSFGIATYPQDGDSTMELIAVADDRMYRSKGNRGSEAEERPRLINSD